jgi:hypothetical protein
VRLIGRTTLIGALFKINRLVAFLTDVFTVELIGKNLLFQTATMALADK